MNIDCIDMTESNLANAVFQGLGAYSVVSTQLQFYGQSNGVLQMVAAVQSALAGSTIDVLRIWGHGGPGLQNVSAGTSGDSADDDFAGITVSNFNQVGLQQLTPLFSSGAWVELRGCSVGAGGEGNALLLDLASLLGVPVYAGDVVQWSVNWNPPVNCAYPSGAMATSAGPLLNANQTPSGS